MRRSRLSWFISLASTSAILSSGLVFADGHTEEEQKSPQKLQDVVVTATKEGERDLQQVPSAITAFPEEKIEAEGIEDIEDLSYQTPGLSVTRNGQGARIYIRGIGTNLDFIGSDPSVVVHVDGVYQSRTSTALNNFLAVERVEVLRGPQGTLYGRNATGGAINVITKKPSEVPEAAVGLELGNYDLYKLSGYANGVLAGENLMGNFAFMTTEHDPYVKNLSDTGISGLADDNTLSSRGALRYLFGENNEVIFRADYTDIDRATGAYKPTGLTPVTEVPSALSAVMDVPDKYWEMNISQDSPFVNLESKGTSAEIKIGLSPALTLTSLTAYRDLDWETVEDTDGSNLSALFTELAEEQDQISEELRLNYQSDLLSLVFGAYYLSEGHTTDTAVNIGTPGGTITSAFDASNDTSAYAVFSQGTVAVTDQFNATLGIRYSHEEKEFKNVNTGPFAFELQQTSDWESWSPNAAVDYTFNEKTMVYASAQRGFKSGGFNLTSSDAEFEPEYVWAYEVGVKTDWLEDTIRTNIATFYYNYTDLQVQNFIVPGSLIVSNAADATVKGLEVETQWAPTYDWLIEFNYTYLDARYDKYLSPSAEDDTVLIDVSGNRLNAAPKNKANVAIQYFHDMDGMIASLRWEYSWQDQQYFTAFNTDVSSQRSYAVINYRASLVSADESWELHGYVENAKGTKYSTSSREFNWRTVGVTKDIGSPLTYGVKLLYRI